MDYDLFKGINGLAGHNGGVDAVMEMIATKGPFILLALMALLWLLPRPTVPRGLERRLVVYAGVTAAIALGLNQIIGHTWDRPRPFLAHHVTLLIAASHDSSFPSDHAALGFGLALPVLIARRDWGFVLLLGALILSFARVYVGAHYPGDIAGSLVVAMASTAIVWACRGLLELPIERLLALLALIGLASTADRQPPPGLLGVPAPV
ncbi:MAG: phosphatase PAP2 family protein [Chloroflexota bacterium]